MRKSIEKVNDLLRLSLLYIDRWIPIQQKILLT
jgi:hypothetical protein